MTPTEDERNWAFLLHAASVVSFFLVPSLVLLEGSQSKWVKTHAIESLNISLTSFIGFLVALMLFKYGLGCFFGGIVLMVAVMQQAAGAQAALAGSSYRYRYTLRFFEELTPRATL